MLKKFSRILFVHNRIGGLDGVSLEISKRAKMLCKAGKKLFFITGDNAYKARRVVNDITCNTLGHTNNTFILDLLKIQSSINQEFLQRIFFNPSPNDLQLQNDFNKVVDLLTKQLQKVLTLTKPDLVYIHNLFSLAYNLLGTVALHHALKNMQVPVILVHHDFWWERQYFHIKPYYNLRFIAKILNTMPFLYDNIVEHQVINSLAYEKLINRMKRMQLNKIVDKGPANVRITPDMWDFTRKYETHPINSIKSVLHISDNTFIILQATRIVERKAIENTIILAYLLQRKLQKLGRNSFFKDVVILFPNFIEVGAQPYLTKILRLAKHYGIRLIFAYNLISEGKFSFWDFYKIAHIVTYMPKWEGFGNQFLEALYFKKPIVLFEYPVFVRDIQQRGFFYISVGKKMYTTNGLNLVPEYKLRQASTKILQLFTKTGHLKVWVKDKLKENYNKLYRHYNLEIEKFFVLQ